MALQATLMNKTVFICFIDYKKAFDNVRHNKLTEIVKSIHLDNIDLTIIKKLYRNQEAKLTLNKNEHRTSFEVKLGQGCILLQFLC